MHTYFLTGITGYIGSMLAKRLLTEGNQVIGLVRDKEKARAQWQTISEREHIPLERLSFFEADITDLPALLAFDESITYIIHCAAPTKSREMITCPVEVADAIVIGTRNILELARKKNIKSMVFLSSMEVYGSVAASDTLTTEADLGDMPLFSTRNCYPLGKRMAEDYCFYYSKEYGIPVKIARLAQTFGPGILPEENRVYAQFAKAVLDGAPIVMHSTGEGMGNYCDIRDAMDGILLLMEKGANGETYNIVNEANSMPIRDMAKLVAKDVAGGSIPVIFDIPQDNQYGYAPPSQMRLSSEKLRKLGFTPKYSLTDMYIGVIDWMKFLAKGENDA